MRSITVTAGAQKLNVDEESQVEIVAGEEDIFTHEEYNPLHLTNDIALIHLKETVPINGELNELSI